MSTLLSLNFSQSDGDTKSPGISHLYSDCSRLCHLSRVLSGLAFIPGKSYLDFMLTSIVSLPVELLDHMRKMLILMKFSQASWGVTYRSLGTLGANSRDLPGV